MTKRIKCSNSRTSADYFRTWWTTCRQRKMISKMQMALAGQCRWGSRFNSIHCRQNCNHSNKRTSTSTFRGRNRCKCPPASAPAAAIHTNNANNLTVEMPGIKEKGAIGRIRWVKQSRADQVILKVQRPKRQARKVQRLIGTLISRRQIKTRFKIRGLT